MASTAPQPNLRLVGDATDIAAWARAKGRRQAVARANREASQNPTLDPTDARWVLAVRTHVLLQGTMLTPERRERVLKTARQLGIRPFEANVIIAIVQDHARRDDPIANAAPTLTLVREARRPSAGAWTWLRWPAALGAAIVATMLLVRWLLAG